MIGIVLWSDPAEHKAVIWCEDQGDLAYFSDPEPSSVYESFYDAGDVVEFDFSTQRNLRLAQNLKSLNQSAGAVLTDELTSIHTMPDHLVSETAKVIPFRAEPARRATRRASDRQKRLG